MVTLLFGGDAFSIQAALKRTLGDGDDDNDTQPFVRLDGSAISWTALREASGARSLFAARQILVVKNLLATWSARVDAPVVKGGSKPTPAEFVEFVRQLPATTDIVLVEGDVPASNRYLKALADLAGAGVAVQEYAIPRDPARRSAWMSGWIKNFVAARGGSIDDRAVGLLAYRVGVDFERASNELDKLLAYTAPLCGIGVADVELLVADDTETSGFDLVNAVGARNQARVADLVDRVLADGMAPEQALAMLSTRIRDLSLLANARVERVSSKSVAATSGWSPGRLGNLERALSNFTPQELHAAQEMLVAADLALKSRPSHERPLVLLLLLLAIARRADPADLARALAY